MTLPRRPLWLVLVSVTAILTLVMACSSSNFQSSPTQSSAPTTSGAGSGGASTPAAGAGTTAAPSGEPIKFGLIDSYGGTTAFLSEPIKNGAELAIKEINGQGGVLGRPLQLVTRDDKSQVDEGLRQARTLVNDEKVAVLMQGINSGVAVAVSGFAKEAKVPYIGVFATTKRLTTQGNEFTYRGNFSTIEIGRAMADYLNQRGFKKIATIAPDYEYGRQFTEDLESALKTTNPNIAIVQKQFPKLGETDYSSFITSLLSEKPDLVVAGIFGSDLVTFVRQAQGFDFFNQTKFFSHFLGDADHLDTLKDALPTGTMATGWYPYWELNTDASKKFAQAYQAGYNQTPRASALLSYNSVKIMVETIKRAGSLDPTKLTTAFNDQSVETPVGTVKVRGCDHQAFVPFFAGEIKASTAVPFQRALADIKRYDTEKLALTCEEVAKARGGG